MAKESKSREPKQRAGIDRANESERRYGEIAEKEGTHSPHKPRETAYQERSQGGRRDQSIHGGLGDDGRRPGRGKPIAE